jgi:hypothetical protein
VHTIEDLFLAPIARLRMVRVTPSTVKILLVVGFISQFCNRNV